jgi:hypothetical protein
VVRQGVELGSAELAMVDWVLGLGPSRKGTVHLLILLSGCEVGASAVTAIRGRCNTYAHACACWGGTRQRPPRQEPFFHHVRDTRSRGAPCHFRCCCLIPEPGRRELRLEREGDREHLAQGEHRGRPCVERANGCYTPPAVK